MPEVTTSASIKVASIPTSIESFTLTAAGATTPLVTQNVSGATSGCSTSGSTFTCTASFTANVGQGEYLFQGFGGTNGTGTVVAHGTLILSIVAGAAAFPVTVSGTESSLGLALSDPNPLEGKSESITLFVTAFDATGEQIVASGAATESIKLAVGAPPSGYSAAPTPSSPLSFPTQTSTALAYTGAHVEGAYTGAFGSYTSQGVTLQSVPPPVASPASITVGVGKTQNFTVTETGYAGQFSAGSGTPTVATVAAGSTAGTFTVTGVSGGNATITVTDSYGHTTTVAVLVTNTGIPVTVPPYSIVLNPSAVTFTIVGQKQVFAASEQGYSGTFTVKSAKTTITSVSPSSGTTFTAKAVASGSTTLTVTDSEGHTAVFSTLLGKGGSIPITIPPTFTASPSALSFTGAGQTATFAVTETGYTGSFTASVDNANVATVTASSTSQFTVTAAGSPGTANITVSDGRGNSVTVTVGVTITTIPIT